MKTTLALALSALAFGSTQALAQGTPGKALEISVFGIGPAVEPQVANKVRSLVAKAFTDNTIDQIRTLGYGIEGGWSLCVELSPWKSESDLAALKKAIDAIPTRPGRTAKNTNFVDSCPQS